MCSEYKNWRCIIHAKYEDAEIGWMEDGTKTNEIVGETIDEFAGEWSED